MKKLLKISIISVLAIGPMAAFASGVPVPYTDGSTTTKPTLTPSSTLATVTYVKGAYNELAEAINTEDTKVGSLSTLTTEQGAAFTGNDASSASDLATAVNAAMTRAKIAVQGASHYRDYVDAQGVDTVQIWGNSGTTPVSIRQIMALPEY